MFLASIFIHVDITVKQRQLVCDRLCDEGPLYRGQVNTRNPLYWRWVNTASFTGAR